MQPSRVLFHRILTPVAATLLATSVVSVGDVTAPTSLASIAKKDDITLADKDSMVAFIDLHVSRLESGDAAERPKARQALLASVYGISSRRATPLFRELYAEQLIPKLKTIMAESDTPQRIAAAQIAGGLGTDSAVSLLMRHITPHEQPDDAVRVWTAASLRPLIVQINVTPSRLNRSIGTLGQAALVEPDWPVLRQQLETLAAATSNQRGEEGGQANLMTLAREQQTAVLTRLIERLKDGELDMLLVIEPHIRRIQQQFLDQNDVDTLRAQARKTVPAVSGLYEAILANWDAIQEDQRRARIAGRALQKAEIMIVLMDNYLTKQSNSTAPKYEDAIVSNNRAPIEAGKTKWATLGDGPAYQ